MHSIFSTPRAPDLVVFDFDGCIADSTTTALRCHRESLARFGVQLSDEDVHAGLGLDADDTIHRLAARHPEVDELRRTPNRLSGVLALNAELLAEADDAPVYSLIPPLFAQLAEQNVRVGIFSSSNRQRIVRILRSNALDAYVDDSLILSHHDLPRLSSAVVNGPLRPKPSGDGLRHLLHLAQVAPIHALYVGDRPEDCTAATAAGMRFLFADWSELAIPPDLSHVRVRSLLDFWALGVIDTIHPRIRDLVRAHQRGELAAFIGAGFSLEAGFDDWRDLVARVTGGPEHGDIPAGDLTKLVSHFMGKHGIAGAEHAWREIWDSLWPVRDPLRKHKILRSLGLGRIWTTNYDSLLEFTDARCQVVTEDAHLTPIDSITQIVKLNGSVHHFAAPIILSEENFSDLFSRRPELIEQLAVDLRSKTMLFLGTSLSDSLTRQMLHRVRDARSRRASVPLDYVVVKSPLPDEVTQLEREYGVVTIDVPEWSGVEHLLTVLKWHTRPHSVIVSGSMIGTSLSDKEAAFLNSVGYLLAASGFTIRIGNGPQIATHVLRGAESFFRESHSPFIHRSRIIRFNRKLAVEDFVDTEGQLTDQGSERLQRLLLDIGTFRFVQSASSSDDLYGGLRGEMCAEGDLLIAIGGDSDSEPVARSIRSAMLAERDLVHDRGVPFLPIPFVRGASRQLYDDLRLAGNTRHLGDEVHQWISELGAIEEAEEAARLTVAIAVLLAARHPSSPPPGRTQDG